MDEGKTQNCKGIEFYIQCSSVKIFCGVEVAKFSVGIASPGENYLIVGVLLEYLRPVYEGLILLIQTSKTIGQAKKGVEVIGLSP
jgi:hypothetical protein